MLYTVLTRILDEFFPNFCICNLWVILNLHTKENTPAELMFLCCTVHTTIASAFIARCAWFLLFVKYIFTCFCRWQKVNFSFASFVYCLRKKLRRVVNISGSQLHLPVFDLPHGDSNFNCSKSSGFRKQNGQLLSN
jgi:hypothetical protein